MNESPQVLIVGAGLTGLACARHLHRRGVSCRVLEASNGVGGRVRSDHLDGFTLDRGFQVYLGAYPEGLEILDYKALDLRPFEAGATVRRDGKWHRFADPWRQPLTAVGSLFGGLGTLDDKLKVAKLRSHALEGTLDELFARPAVSTLAALERFGFSSEMIDGFFRPFLGGILLDRDLAVSSRMLDFVFRMMAKGQISVPAAGMGAIPRQLADSLPAETIGLGMKVDAAADGRVVVAGESMTASAVVVATDRTKAGELVREHLAARGADDFDAGLRAGERAGDLENGIWNGSTCLYFAADAPPKKNRHLLLNGDSVVGSSRGGDPGEDVVVNSVAAMSLVAPEYSPEGQELISVSLVGNPSLRDDQLELRVRSIMAEWFGASVSSWRHLATYRIPRSLPRFTDRPMTNKPQPLRLGDRLYVAGDWLASPSIQGALVSGRTAAEAILRDQPELLAKPE